jgi:hypothetical protein
MECAFGEEAERRAAADAVRNEVREYAAARVAQAVAQERERCAGICDGIERKKWLTLRDGGTFSGIGAADCARAIRAGSPSPQPAPAGWRLVPEEWTRDMRHAFIHAAARTITGKETAGWEAALAAAPQPPSAWRPIEEAPRDGTDVLIYVAATAEQFVGYWRDDSNAFVIAPNGRGGWSGLKDPTHWQPLPPPPSAGEEPTP